MSTILDLWAVGKAAYYQVAEEHVLQQRLGDEALVRAMVYKAVRGHLGASGLSLDGLSVAVVWTLHGGDRAGYRVTVRWSGESTIIEPPDRSN